MKTRPAPEVAPPELLLPSALPTIWQPLPKQFLALSCPADIILFGGAVGGGKTEYLLADWVAHSSAYGQFAVGVIARRTRDELAEIQKRAWNYFPKLGAKWIAAKRTWVFQNGATLLMTYLKTDSDARRFGGHQFTWVGIDEAGEFPSPVPIDFLLSRIRSTAPIPIHKKLLMTANPGGPGHKWLYERYVKDRVAGEPFHAIGPNGKKQRLTSVYIASRLTDNPYLMADRDYRDRVRASGPGWLVRALIAGDWSISISGNIFFREWLTDNRYQQVPPGEKILTTIISGDLAAKDKPENDRSAFTVWAITERAAYLIHAWAGRCEFPEVKKKAEDLFERFKPSVVLIEDASAGIQLIQTLRRETRLPIIAIKPQGHKTARAIAASVHFEAEPRKILFPAAADWLDEVVEELCAFDKAKHDDIVDSVVQAILYIFKHWNLTGSTSFTAAGLSVQPKNVEPTPVTAHQRYMNPKLAAALEAAAEQSVRRADVGVGKAAAIPL